ncbi:iron-containing alcohol dehydrogenase [bacterium 3DAC]|nr:iron-containing alcohol dehydrogenase [bacterium 3DAC]
MRNFVFHNPTKYVFGKDTVKKIGEEIVSFGSKKVLLVAGGGSIKKNGVYDTVVDSLKKHGIQWVELWGVRPNPVLSKVKEGIEIAKKENVDGVLAVGGGSVIDTAKTIAHGLFIDNVWDMFVDSSKVPDSALPIYVVLTISATGSEMNGGAVITNEETGQKWAFSSPLSYPKVSIVDPTVQFSLPKKQTANGGSDALSHILEAYITGKPTDTTVYYDEGLMRSIIDNIDTLMVDPRNYEARASFAWAATLALNGISSKGLAGDWLSHAIEHAISAIYPDVAHGSGLAVVHPAVLMYRRKHNPEILKRWAQQVWGENTIEGGIERLRAKYKEWGLPISLKELGVKPSDWQSIIDKTVELGWGDLWEPITPQVVEEILRYADI